MQLYDLYLFKQKLIIIPHPDKYLVFNGFPLVGRPAIAGANLTNK